ncbi:hypothetical protein PHYBOEH_006916 [Phytophthora boehmeriae]|uniref:N-acetyltransferase domain-containing protein n=1 Tax=Phytophthora boehmeriae TaxID=109152 RepID=A0A8T1WF29_9STRA|nr:hypothetical protein PHYBOEH_006916 [Phytophthora boehmeriae]
MDKFRVVRLTREELKVQCKNDDFEEWGAPALNLPQYQRKEQLQRETAFSQRGSVFWALVEKSDSDENSIDDSDLVAGRTALCCHCESHRFDCVLRRQSGEIERGYSHHIGSVFTLPEFRKRGLATFFMKQVAKQLAQFRGALVSVLYSDIGPTYYDKLGWRLHPSQMATLDVTHPRNAKTNNDSIELIPLALDQELDEFFKADNDRLVEELSSAKFEGREAFVILPTRDSLEWQFCIGVHFARERGFDELPSCCGVKANTDAFVVWSHNVRGSTLNIVRARLPDVGDDHAIATTRALMNAALEEARKFQLKKVAIWNPPPVLLYDDVRHHLEIEVDERNDSLSSAMVFHNGSVDVDGDAKTPLPHWLSNEKYAWV